MYEAALMWAWWNPSAEFEQILKKGEAPLKDHTNSDSNCIAMHVRRGDVCGKSDLLLSSRGKYRMFGEWTDGNALAVWFRVCAGFDEYMALALDIQQKHKNKNYRTIFIATDSPEVIRSSRKYANKFRFVFQEGLNRSVFESKETVFVEDLIAKDKKKYGNTPIQDVLVSNEPDSYTSIMYHIKHHVGGCLDRQHMYCFCWSVWIEFGAAVVWNYECATRRPAAC